MCIAAILEVERIFDRNIARVNEIINELESNMWQHLIKRHTGSLPGSVRVVL